MFFKSFCTVAFLSFSFGATGAFASNYAILMDAGSTGTRVHLFQYEKGTNAIAPHEINFYGKDSNKSKTPISSTDITKPLDTFQKPFLLAVDYLFNKNHIPQNQVGVFVYSTAGMRVLDDKKRLEINNSVKEGLNKEYPSLEAVDVRTILGQEEALYAWVDVNYLKGNLNSNTENQTTGIVDVGGASAQIAFESSSPASGYQLKTVNLFGKNYTLYLNSILHGGQDQARNEMVSQLKGKSNVCFIEGSDSSIGDSKFLTQDCEMEYSKILSSGFMSSENPSDKSLIPVPPPAMNFLATSSVYYAYSFFGAQQEETVSPSRLLGNVNEKCTLSWDNFQAAFPASHDNYFTQHCANGVYVYELLTENGYKFSDNSNFAVATQIIPTIDVGVPIVDVDWTLGALIVLEQRTIGY